MTSFRFIHAADLHLGSPFQGLALKDAALAARFAEASREAFSALVSRAIEEKADFLIVAGDVYDGDWKDNSIGLFFNREVARLGRENIPVFLIKGNHDAESVITRTITLPGNVHEFPVNRPGTVRLADLKVALHGQGFAERSAQNNLALDYPPPEQGWFNIGLLHTSLTGREPHAPYAPCSVDDLRSRGYDYWALGHVHDFEVVAEDPLVIFPGNLQGRSIREQGAKGAVLVSVEDHRIRTERMIVDRARFHEIAVTVVPDDDLAVLVSRVAAAAGPFAEAAEGRVVALRLRLAGETPLAREFIARAADMRDEMQAALHRAGGDVWLEKLVLDLHPPKKPAAPGGMADLEGLLPEGDWSLEMIAEAETRIREIAAKLPGGIGAGDLPLGADAAALLAEARALLLSRSGEDA
ncbi:DNA repair exonuclease [Rhizobiaceae bacterium BDR2-2]|uniref:DNA repair exonuclease n=1 Tax=Ectorhizobium quercum TaxID=2965071 RepID=A0AAE3SXW7_9HYPH|nr:DNA repair exonuclease [Ectorhizobium quercum]MCX8998935.1 DNA repair exonuclease [Ectorhizobium quercum]